jgi:hypothetical protein
MVGMALRTCWLALRAWTLDLIVPSISPDANVQPFGKQRSASNLCIRIHFRLCYTKRVAVLLQGFVVNIHEYGRTYRRVPTQQSYPAALLGRYSKCD